MAVNVKLDVDLGGFNSGINAAKAEVKTLDQQMKMIDATFKATGNAEQAMSQKTQTLNKQMDAQKRIATQAEQALKAMTKAGVDPASASYQRMAQELLKAQTGMMNTQVALNGLGDSAQEAASGADQLTNSVNSIGKKISLDQVISGIDRITSGLENAAKKAVDLGEKLWNTIMDSAKRADDTATMAEMYGIDLDTFMKMQKLVTGGMDTSVDAMLSAQDKLKKGIGKESKEVIGYLKELGVSAYEMYGSPKYGDRVRGKARDTLEVFWETGQALMAMGDAYDQEAAAQALFGKSWKELRPLFNTYKDLEEYNKARDAQTVNTEETIRDLAALNDAVSKLEGSWTTLKDEVLGALAPALTSGADAISGLLDSLTEYLKTEDGQKLLESLGSAMSSLFEDIGKIDPETVVENFTSVFNSLVGGLQWIVANKNTLISALKAVVIGWGGLKLTGGILSIIKLIDGLRDLGVIGGGASAATGATATGAGGGLIGALTSGVGKVLPGVQLWSSTNGGPVMDWLMHESPIASVIQGTETWDQWWTRQKEEQAQRTESFGENWDPTSENANVIAQAIGKVLGYEQQTSQPEVNSAGLTDEQIHNMRLFYQTYKEITEKGPANVCDTTLEYYNKAGNALNELFSGNEEQLSAYMKKMQEAAANGQELLGDDFFNIGPGGVEITVNPVAPENASGMIAEQVGTVTVPVEFQIRSDYVNLQQYILKQMGVGNANGLSYVPNEGLYHLHKGERVVPAREVASRSYNSNLYVESMYMNNGTDAAGLASAMAAAQRRTMSGFGS